MFRRLGNLISTAFGTVVNTARNVLTYLDPQPYMEYDDSVPDQEPSPTNQAEVIPSREQSVVPILSPRENRRDMTINPRIYTWDGRKFTYKNDKEILHMIVYSEVTDFIERSDNGYSNFITIRDYINGLVEHDYPDPTRSLITFYDVIRSRIDMVLKSLPSNMVVKVNLVPTLTLAKLDNQGKIVIKEDGRPDVQRLFINQQISPLYILNPEMIDTAMDDYVTNLDQYIRSKIDGENYERSGVNLIGIDTLNAYINAANHPASRPGGRRYFEIPEEYIRQSSLVNPKNDDDYCILWCVHLYQEIQECIKEHGSKSKIMKNIARFATQKKRKNIVMKMKEDIDKYCESNGIPLINYEFFELRYLDTISKALNVNFTVFTQDFNFNVRLKNGLPMRCNQRVIYNTAIDSEVFIPVYLVTNDDWLDPDESSESSEYPRSSHFCLINEPNRFMAQSKKNYSPLSICIKCGEVFKGSITKGVKKSDKEKLKEHQRDNPECYIRKKEITLKNNLVFDTVNIDGVTFPIGRQKKLGRSVRAFKAHPLVIYADLESLSITPSHTIDHVPGIQVDSVQEPYQSNMVVSSLNCPRDILCTYFCSAKTRRFIDGELQEGSPQYSLRVEIFDHDTKRLINLTVLEQERIRRRFIDTVWLNRPYPKTPKLDGEDLKTFEESEVCTFCGDVFDYYDERNKQWRRKKIIEHCHFTNKFLGASCISCNRDLTWDKSVNIYYHNLSGYDGKLLNRDFDIHYIPKNLSGGYRRILLDEDYNSLEFEDLKNLPKDIQERLPYKIKKMMIDIEQEWNDFKKDNISEHSLSGKKKYFIRDRSKDFSQIFHKHLNDLDDDDPLLVYIYEKMMKTSRRAIVETLDTWKTFTLLPKLRYHDTLKHTNSSLDNFVKSVNKTLTEEERLSVYQPVREYLMEIMRWREEEEDEWFEMKYDIDNIDPNDDSYVESYKSIDLLYFCESKGVFPYNTMTSYKVLQLDHLPEDIELYDSKESFEKAKKDWEKLGCKTMMDYSGFYGMLDVLLLQCAFDYTRKVNMDKFRLDPCGFLGIPSYSLNYVLSRLNLKDDEEYSRPWGENELALAMNELSAEKVDDSTKLEQKIGMYYGPTLTSLPTKELQDFVSESVRGGYCSPTYKRIYRKKDDSSYLICLDVNSLYPSAMLKDLALCVIPKKIHEDGRISFFCRPSKQEGIYKMLDVGRNSQYQYEVDLVIPDNIQESIDALPKKYRGKLLELQKIINQDFNGSLHEYLRTFPPIIELFAPTKEMLSEYNKNRVPKNYNGTSKLMTHFLPVNNYKVFNGYLKFLVFELGVRIVKVHRYLEYYSSSFLKDIIQELYDQRRVYRLAGNDVMQQNVKLIMNSMFGKLLESLDNRSKFEIVDDRTRFLKETSKDSFHSATVINDNFMMIKQQNIDVEVNNTIHTGASVLDNSKLILLKHFYQMKKHFRNRLNCYYTDTDSVFIEVPKTFLDECITSGIYKDSLDMSSFVKVNRVDDEITEVKDVLLPMKDKSLFTVDVAKTNDGQLGVLSLEGGVISHAVFLKPKSYAYKYENDSSERGYVYKHKGGSKKSKLGEIGELSEYIDEQMIEDMEQFGYKMLYYYNCILGDREYKATNEGFRSFRFDIYHGKSYRTLLSPVCDKMNIMNDGIEMFPYGYKEYSIEC